MKDPRVSGLHRREWLADLYESCPVIKYLVLRIRDNSRLRLASRERSDLHLRSLAGEPGRRVEVATEASRTGTPAATKDGGV
jgi:hypothetical protein